MNSDRTIQTAADELKRIGDFYNNCRIIEHAQSLLDAINEYRHALRVGGSIEFSPVQPEPGEAKSK